MEDRITGQSETLRFPIGLLRAILNEPTSAEVQPCRQDTVLRCHAGRPAPLVVGIVPGIADSCELDIVSPLAAAIRQRLSTTVAPLVTVANTPWPLELDIPAFAKQLHDFVQSTLREYRGCRLALVAFSLGGTAALYYLTKYRAVAMWANHPPLVITLASPTQGSERYRHAVSRWRGLPTERTSGAFPAVAVQLEDGSEVMAAVRSALVRDDVHVILSSHDRIVDHAAARPPVNANVIELDIECSSPLKRHFEFPRHPVVMDTVIHLLQNHAGVITMTSDAGVCTAA